MSTPTITGEPDGDSPDARFSGIISDFMPGYVATWTGKRVQANFATSPDYIDAQQFVMRLKVIAETTASNDDWKSDLFGTSSRRSAVRDEDMADDFLKVAVADVSTAARPRSCRHAALTRLHVNVWVFLVCLSMVIGATYGASFLPAMHINPFVAFFAVGAVFALTATWYVAAADHRKS